MRFFLLSFFISCGLTAACVDTAIPLSDLIPTSSTNGWGPAEINKSNGEQGTGDGKALTIAGKVYTKGFGVHAPSDLHFALASKYNTFTSDIGIDDEVLSNTSCTGTVNFQVHVDGIKIYESGILKKGVIAKSIQLDVTGKNDLRLVVQDGGDGAACDHADWAGAQLLSTKIIPVVNTPSGEAPLPPVIVPPPTGTQGTVYDLTKYGAKVNDGTDDTAALRSAIAASKAGDTILFTGGVFNFSGQIDFASDRLYLGRNGGTLTGKGPQGQLVVARGDNIKIVDLTFNGGGVYFESTTRQKNILVDNNVFNINTSGTNPNGITCNPGLENSKITNNLFTGYNSSFGIYGYNYNNLTIANNEFIDVTAGMHIDWGGGPILVEQNYMKGLKGMGMEFQSTGKGLVFQDNYYEKPDLSPIFASNNGTMAYSLILDKASDITIRRNSVIAPERPDGKGCRVGFELGGDNTMVSDNYINGINNVAAMNDGEATASVTFRDNFMDNFLEPPRCSFCNADRKWTAINNSNTVKLTWPLTRGRPYRNKRY